MDFKKLLNNILIVFKKNKNSNFIALDLGTTNTLAYVKDHGIIYNEPSLLAYDTRTNQLIAYGNEAFNLLGKTHNNIKIIRPLIDGVISDLDATKKLVINIFSRMKLLNIWKNATVVLACPSGVTQLERQALKKVAEDMGAKNVIIEEEVKMSAIGAGKNIKLPKGNLIVDIGGGTCNTAIIASNDIVNSNSIRVAGNYIDEEIIKSLRSNHNIIIGYQTAINIKHTIGAVSKVNEIKTMKVYGRDVISGMPKEIEINEDEIIEICRKAFILIKDSIMNILQESSEGFADDIMKNGITLCGGTSKIKGLEKYFNEEFNLPVQLASNPLMCVIDGAKSLEKEVAEILEKQKLNNTFISV